jgi:hypothetical protein
MAHCPMAAGGMRYEDRRRTLAQRPIGGQARESPDPDGTACWVALGDQRVPGTVHGWYRGRDGAWTALVLAWIPSDRLEPRD